MKWRRKQTRRAATRIRKRIKMLVRYQVPSPACLRLPRVLEVA